MGFYIDMIEVQQGDAFLLTLGTASRDVTFLIDGGPASDDNPVPQFVNTYASNRVDVIIATHLDDDHIGGLGRVVAECRVQNFFMNLPVDPRKSLATLLRQRYLEKSKADARWSLLEKSLQTATELADALKENGLEPKPLRAGMSWTFGDYRINVLSPSQERL